MKISVYLSLLSLLFVIGCGSTPTVNLNGVARLDFAKAAGRSPKLHSGGGFAYWIWREDDGSWHLRTTSGRQGHRFQGTVRSSIPGAIQEVKGVGIDAPGRKKRGGGDHLTTENGEIVFDFVTKASVDGFDFQLAGDSCVEFELRIDGDGDAGKIFIGKGGMKPDKPRFVFCLK